MQWKYSGRIYPWTKRDGTSIGRVDEDETILPKRHTDCGEPSIIIHNLRTMTHLKLNLKASPWLFDSRRNIKKAKSSPKCPTLCRQVRLRHSRASLRHQPPPQPTHSVALKVKRVKLHATITILFGQYRTNRFNLVLLLRLRKFKTPSCGSYTTWWFKCLR